MYGFVLLMHVCCDVPCCAVLCCAQTSYSENGIFVGFAGFCLLDNDEVNYLSALLAFPKKVLYTTPPSAQDVAVYRAMYLPATFWCVLGVDPWSCMAVCVDRAKTQGEGKQGKQLGLGACSPLCKPLPPSVVRVWVCRQQPWTLAAAPTHVCAQVVTWTSIPSLLAVQPVGALSSARVSCSLQVPIPAREGPAVAVCVGSRLPPSWQQQTRPLVALTPSTRGCCHLYRPPMRMCQTLSL